MRKYSKIIDISLPIIGVALIVMAFLPALEPEAIGAIVAGTVTILAGISRVSRHFFQTERRFLALRAEGELFLNLMRQLNTAAVALKESDSPENRSEFEEVKDAMRQAVERMANAAGKTVEQIAQDAGQPDSVVLWKNDFFGTP